MSFAGFAGLFLDNIERDIDDRINVTSGASTTAASDAALHPTTIYRLLRDKQIPGFRVGGDWRFDSGAIDRWCTEEEKVAVTARYKGAS
jgi:excisionase family DNA binding protein